MKQINLQDKNSKEWQIFKSLVQKYQNDIDSSNFRNIILEAVCLYGAEGINVLKAGFMDAKIDLAPFNKAVAKIISQLFGIEEL